MVSSADTSPASPASSRLAAPFHVSGSAGTSTRNRINASLAKQHFVLNPNTLAHPIPSTTNRLFDAVPRNAQFESLSPILARLPDHDQDDTHAPDQLESLDYVLHRGVMYTRSRLPFLDPASIHLWNTLHHFRPLTADYASGYLERAAPHPLPLSSANLASCPAFASASLQALHQLRTSFNWSSLPALPSSISRVWYGVLFLSLRKPGSESVSFYEADRLAHEEATRSGGLIMYWYGSPHPTTGANLATCIWSSRTHAIQASKLALHKKAAQYAAPSYERYDLIRYKLVKLANESNLRIEAWTHQDDQNEHL